MADDDAPQLRPRGLRPNDPAPQSPPESDGGRGPRRVVPLAAGAAVLLIGGVIAAVVLAGGGGEDDAVQPVVAAVAPAPTTTAPPAASPTATNPPGKGLPGAGQPLELSQDGQSALVPAADSGALVRIDLAQLTVGGNPEQAPQGRQLYAGADQAYLVDRSTGTVQRVDPADFSPVGPEVDLGARLGRPQVDPQGTLWVPVPERGELVPVRASEAGTPVQVARDGRPLFLTLAAGRPVVTDPIGGRATLINPDGGKLQVKLPEEIRRSDRDKLLVPSTTEGSVVPLLAPEQKTIALVDVDARSVQLIPFAPQGRELYEPQVLGNRLYIPDQSTGELIVYDIAAGAFRPSVTVSKPGGELQAFVRNGRLWINDQRNNVSAVIDADGRVKPIGTVKQTVTIKFLNALRKVLEDVREGRADEKSDHKSDEQAQSQSKKKSGGKAAE